MAQYGSICTGGAPVCSPRYLYSCVFPTVYNFTVTNAASRCNCRRQCRQLSYTYTVSQAEYSDHAIRSAQSFYSRNLSDAQIRRNYATMEVYLLHMLHMLSRVRISFPLTKIEFQDTGCSNFATIPGHFYRHNVIVYSHAHKMH